MGSSNKIFSGVFWSVITSLVNALYGFIMVPILITHFGKAEYGLIGLAQSVNAYMQLMDMGLTSTNVRFFSNWLAGGDYFKVKKLFSTCTAFYGCVGLVNVAVLLIVLLFSNTIFNVTPEQDVLLKKLLCILAIAALINWFTSCYNQIIQATENVAWTQKRLLITKVLLVCSLVVTVWLDLSITVYFFLTVLSNWLILPLVIRKVKQVAPMVSFMPRFDKKVFLEIFPYTFNLFLFSIFQFSYANLQPVFLGVRNTVESVADYKVIMGVVGICSVVTNVFLNAMLPSSSKALANNDKKAYDLIAYNGTKYIMIFLGFCVFGMIAIDKDLLTIYVGKSFLYLIPCLNLILLALLSRHMNAIASLILGGTDLKPIVRMTAFSAISALAVSWVFVPTYGVLAVAFSVLCFELLQALFYYLYYFPRKMNIRSGYIFIHIFVPVTLEGILCYVLVSWIPSSSSLWVNVLIKGSSFSLIYLIMMYLFINKNDKMFLFSLLKKH